MTANYAPNQSHCYVRLPFAGIDGHTWRLQDQLSDAVYDRKGSDLLAHGLYLDEVPWQSRVFKLTTLRVERLPAATLVGSRLEEQ